MKVVDTVQAMRQTRSQIAGSVGFVPTMGYLHEGHLSLVRQARADNNAVVVSIFVNPIQFGPKEDLGKYPRDLERDMGMLSRERVDHVFVPAAEEMYPPRFNCYVEVGDITERLEGAARPGHFRGVATVVAKLFNIVQPTRAYFGQKDAQQLLVIKKMVADLNMNLEVVGMPTLRERDGLALSSRNTFLNAQERRAATVLYRSLVLAEKLWDGGERDAMAIRDQMMALIQKEPLASVDYVSIADKDTLKDLDTIGDSALVSLAVRIGSTRLIDNVVLGK